MKLSIVTTLYKSANYIVEFHQRITAEAKKVTDSYEIIFVNDGSPDDSLNLALQLQTKHSNILVVDLARNFGHHAAIVAGIEHAQGDYVFLLDCDLEEQPEWLTLFIETMKQTNADVIFGIQQQRVASKTSNFFGSLFWKSLNILSHVKIPDNPMTCRLMKKDYVNALLTVGDRVLYLAGVFAWTGFKQHPIQLIKTPRPLDHKSTYSLSKKLLQVADSFSSFSIAPLSLIFLFGLSVWLVSILYGIYLLILKLLEPELILSGFTSMMLSIWFLSGFIIVALGIIGMYIGKIFQEVKRRPLYITKKIYKGHAHE